MREGARGVPDASYFLNSGCEPLRAGLGITSLLLPTVNASHMTSAVVGGSMAIDLGNEIIWDDFDTDDRKLSAAAFMNHLSVMRVRRCSSIVHMSACVFLALQWQSNSHGVASVLAVHALL